MHLKNSKKQLTRVNVDGKIVKLSQNRGGLKALQTKGPRKGKVDVKIVSKKRKKYIDNARKRW